LRPPRVTVRAATPADAKPIQRVYAPVVQHSAASFEESAPDSEEIARRMLLRPRLPWLVAEMSGSVAGYAFASTHRERAAYRWSVDCAVYVDTPFRSQGAGRLLYERLVTEVVELGYVSLFAGVALPNQASVSLHEALGFEAVGVFRHVGYKHGDWRDVGWWQKSLTKTSMPPPEPREWQPTP